MTKRLGLLVFAVLAATLLYNCRKDVTIEPPPSLTGTYSGTYTRAVQSPDSTAVVQQIVWIFTDTKYRMSFDPAHYPKDGTGATICDCSGIYVVTSGILLQAQTSLDSNITKRTCKKDYAPDGQYQLDQSVENEVTMTCLSPNLQGTNVLRTIKLTKTQ